MRVHADASAEGEPRATAPYYVWPHCRILYRYLEAGPPAGSCPVQRPRLFHPIGAPVARLFGAGFFFNRPAKGIEIDPHF